MQWITFTQSVILVQFEKPRILSVKKKITFDVGSARFVLNIDGGKCSVSFCFVDAQLLSLRRKT